jgi:glycosyltransferase involved in cell wall biosynthesis
MGGLWPLNTGGRQRTFQILSALSERHSVVVLTTDGRDDDPDGLRRHLPDCEEVISIPFQVPKQGSFRFARSLVRSWFSGYPVDLWKWRVDVVERQVRTLVAAGNFDVVVADFLFAAVNVPEDLSVPVVFFAHNVEHLIWKRLAEVERRWWRRPVLEMEWRKVKRAESRACRAASLTVAVSKEDATRLEACAPGAAVTAIPTGVDTTYFQPGRGWEIPQNLVFSGSMDWYPNEDAMLFWVDEILPRVRREIPDVSLTIVGRNPSPRVRALGGLPGIRVTGTVEDVRPAVGQATLYIVPLRIGGGTRLKIFEALAMGKAVLSTSIGAEGLGLTPGVHVGIADGAENFARTVVALLQDPARRDALGRAGRALVEERYSWPRVAEEFDRALQKVSAPHGAFDAAECRAVVSR